MQQLRCWLPLLLLMLALLTPSGIGYAQDTGLITDDQVNALAEDLYCPVCENVPLDVCPTTACAQWRNLIREKMELGWSESQIKEFFAEQYGDQVLAVPPRRGFNWLIYVLPPLIFVAGIAIMASIITRSSKRSAQSLKKDPSSKDLTGDDLIEEIERDLKRMQ
jgi:cytochrome c-type biogenesis protein CcmH